MVPCLALVDMGICNPFSYKWHYGPQFVPLPLPMLFPLVERKCISLLFDLGLSHMTCLVNGTGADVTQA